MNKELKYILTGQTLKIRDVTLYRIQAVKTFKTVTGETVQKGSLGGYVESVFNLAQTGSCWIADEAKAYGYGRVTGDAIIRDRVEVYDSALVGGYSQVYDYANISGNAIMYGHSQIYDRVQIVGESYISNSIIRGYTYISGRVDLRDATINGDTDFQVFKNTWSSGRYFYWTKSNNMWRVGCFYGTGWKLIKKAFKDSFLSGISYMNVVIMRNIQTVLENIFRKKDKYEDNK